MTAVRQRCTDKYGIKDNNTDEKTTGVSERVNEKDGRRLERHTR